MPRSDKSDVFISYHRKTSTHFVTKLISSLQEQGLEVWHDKEDIAPGRNFVDAFKQGIRDTEVVVIVLTNGYVSTPKDAVELPNCHKELLEAMEYGKRIIPVIYQENFDFKKFQEFATELAKNNQLEITPEDAPDKINAIFFPIGKIELVDEEVVEVNYDLDEEQQNEFKANFAKLYNAVQNVDEYTRKHTEYIGRAKQWVDSNHSYHHLLQGTAIKDAENWLATPPPLTDSSSPTPTELHKKYIQISRKVQIQRDTDKQELETKAARRQRNFTLLLFGGMLAIIAYFLFISYDIEEKNYVRNSILFNSVGNVAVNFMDLDVIATLSVAVQAGNSDTYNQLINIHYEELNQLYLLYPNVNVYTLTPDLQVIAAAEESVIPEDEYASVLTTARNFLNEYGTEEYVPTTSYEKAEATETIPAGYYNIGFVDIYDQNDEVIAILVFESSDQLGSTISNIEIINGTLILLLPILIGFFLIGFFWRTLRGFFSKEDGTSDKLQALVNQELKTA